MLNGSFLGYTFSISGGPSAFVWLGLMMDNGERRVKAMDGAETFCLTLIAECRMIYLEHILAFVKNYETKQPRTEIS